MSAVNRPRSLDREEAAPTLAGGGNTVAVHALERDMALMQRIGTRDESALESFYHAHGQALFAIASQMLFSEQDARDVLQECFLKIWDKAATYDARLASPVTWAVMQLRSLCIDRMRRIHRYTARIERLRSIPGALPSHDEGGFLLRELHDRVQLALGDLPDAERQCVMLAVFSEMTHEEVAGTLAQPIGTVKSRLRRGMEKLRTTLRNAYE